ncbi:nitroreductase family deazaflavin-dependent oxidoreductase [Streptomyces sp. NRRL S-340]|uniref:nitroreductase family deazaflavin-dependent oxidoreductase n=1 Tax=Streptomyces sp. NRRL S-340 TaxID=1463901 RepID=UPI000568A27D|nr:nitroreductase family deazaflavin-dependent oxidoreductase [Streptomyces sp. NRRL S-340]
MGERPEPVRHRPPPTGWQRAVARLPLRLYRAGLGPLSGQRMLLLHHTGRTSGLDRTVVLEVVTRDPAGGSWTIVSGFGPEADWYQNLRRRPETWIQVGNRRHRVTARFLPPQEGGDLMVRYAPRHPRLARRLCAFMGFRVDGSEAGYRRVGESIPFVRLEAVPGPGATRPFG